MRKGEDDNGILWNLKGFGDWVRVDLKENLFQMFMKILFVILSLILFSFSSFGQSKKYQSVGNCVLQIMEERELTGNRMFDLVLEECERLFQEDKYGLLFLYEINSKLLWITENNENNLGKYIGKITNEIPHGEGILYFKNKDKYQGEWSEGEFQGIGTYFHHDGKTRIGSWEKGKPWEVLEFDDKGEIQRVWEQGIEIENEIIPLTAPLFLPIGTFTTTLKDKGRYIKISLQLMIKDLNAYKLLKSRIIEIKDITLGVFQNLSVKQVKSPEGRESLREELINEISILLPKGSFLEDENPIQKILFEEFVLQ